MSEQKAWFPKEGQLVDVRLDGQETFETYTYVGIMARPFGFFVGLKESGGDGRLFWVFASSILELREPAE